MAGLNRFGFLVTAAVFHIVYVASIFDIYFVSPVVSGMQLMGVERRPPAKPPADRLVLIVGDGLRADKAFQSFPEPYPKSDDDLTPRPLAPFLRSRVLEHGTFGVSHTRVPTESRPGHVALIAGLYEDVSAVATGWKLNPVDFDSLFNRSRHTWSWGSPDILPMFERGAVPGRVDTDMYDAEFEDFSKEAVHLDHWVFDHVRDFFADAAKNSTLNEALRQDKVVFFLHLLGIDTTGHGFRPYSPEYLNNIKVVDQGVKEMTDVIQKFYADERTAFVFTADHGMSDYGSHGDGHPDNTRTPLIAWGSGIAAPQLHHGTVAPGHDEYSSDWALDHVTRHDVAQADVAALMAYLIGTEFPANSVGQLPLPYLAADNREKAEALLVNAQGILEMYRVKEEKKSAAQLRFVPFEPLSENGQRPEQRIAGIRDLITAGKFEEAVEEADALIIMTLEGLRYLQTYDWLFLRTIVTLGYLGWMAYAITTVIGTFVVQDDVPPHRSVTSISGFASVLVALYASFIISKSPVTYYVYAFFPVVFWEEVYARKDSLQVGYKALFGHIKTPGALLTFVFHILIFIAVIQSLALGYIHRETFTALFIIGAVWPATYGLSFLQSHLFLSAAWAVSCLVMSVFTLLPAMKVESIELILVGGALMLAVGLFYLAFEDFVLADFSWTPVKSSARNSRLVGRVLIGVQLGLIVLSMVVTRSSALSIQSNQGLPLGNQVVGWIVLSKSIFAAIVACIICYGTHAVPTCACHPLLIERLVVSFLMPLAYKLDPTTQYLHRLMVVFLTCAPTFVILTISYEGLFYFAFSILLLLWVRLEDRVQRFVGASSAETSTQGVSETATPFRSLQLSDARVALFFMIFLQSAFFSTGNVASISAFSLESVNRLFPKFDPFSQGALLIVKLMIPFALISANLGVLNKILGVAPSALFMVVMAVSDILTLYFFWVVKDEGSWLEIGSTISHFAIASLLGLFVTALEPVSAFFISGMILEDAPRANRANGKSSQIRHEETNGAASRK